MIQSAQNTPFLAPEPEIPPPPKQLKAAGRRFWAAVMGAFAVESHQFELLLFASIQADRAAQAGRRLRRATSDRQRERLAAAERAAQKAFLITRRELALDAPAKEQRGPRVGGRY